MRVSRLIGAALAAAAICTTASAGVVNSGNNGNGGNSDSELVPTGKGWGERPANFQGQHGQANGAGKKPGVGSNGINCHGGPVMLGGPNVYYIWYGIWTNNAATAILTDLAAGLNRSPYFNINSTYTDASGTSILNEV